ncbi:hypothetical protein CSB45_13985 [candidate division KSB3 bacterium]|uniref:DarT domain-containing protein n=1 Tax=candidate division KSB3 bacterium TaxID=2044937 RepID=A0A2G6E160_9BACT|nr:MAG: hypothetical protein CSB45_13985 [candidate division KSB3 bacterium]PIE28436.1 MAG: hypothetical protein CSA57_13630 [candidate division KSB3 bacterium]
MEWIIGIFILWLIGTLFGGSSKSKNESTTTSKIKKDDSYSDISNAFNQYGIESVWHMTHKNNVREILSSGILSNKTAYEIKKPMDISDHGVQRWRELKDPIYGKKLHEYAPTYINIKNPMLYVRRNIQHDVLN